MISCTKWVNFQVPFLRSCMRKEWQYTPEDCECNYLNHGGKYKYIYYPDYCLYDYFQRIFVSSLTSNLEGVLIATEALQA